MYAIPGQICDFCSDLFSPFVDSDIPCVKSGKRDLSGKTFIRNNQKCTDVDYKIADNLIAVWDESSSKLTSGYSNRATIAEKNYRDGYDLSVDVPAWGSGQRKCRQCPPGTYISKDSKKPRFQQITCKPCPKGMVSARIDDTNPFIPQDVKDLTTEHDPNAQFPVQSYESFGCRACSKRDGVGKANNNACFQCQRDPVTLQYQQYQRAEYVAIGSGLFSLVMGTECQFCPAGYEFYNWKAQSPNVPCRSRNGVFDCCRICLPNSYSAGNGARCQPVASNQGTETSFGALQAKSCAVGEELVYCSTSGLCLSSTESRKIGWRT